MQQAYSSAIVQRHKVPSRDANQEWISFMVSLEWAEAPAWKGEVYGTQPEGMSSNGVCWAVFTAIFTLLVCFSPHSKFLTTS